MGCFQSKHVELPTLPVVEGRVAPAPPPPPRVVGESSSATVSRIRRKTSSPREPDPTHHQESWHRKRARSTPQRSQAMRDRDWMPSFERQRTKSVTAPSTHSRPPVPELPKPKVGGRTRRPSRKSLLPMVRRVLPDHPRYVHPFWLLNHIRLSLRSSRCYP
ncbi:hypothetical protein BJV74DRAFT_354375 [Russula compacta]|nr:hypothetical protein BJV74DRAFT_354375 [Russula compacta]